MAMRPCWQSPSSPLVWLLSVPKRLLRYCARPPFAMERLRKEGATLVYRCTKQRSEPTNDKRGAKVDELQLVTG